jgi:hypothetical protein
MTVTVDAAQLKLAERRLIPGAKGPAPPSADHPGRGKKLSLNPAASEPAAACPAEPSAAAAAARGLLVLCSEPSAAADDCPAMSRLRKVAFDSTTSVALSSNDGGRGSDGCCCWGAEPAAMLPLLPPANGAAGAAPTALPCRA